MISQQLKHLLDSHRRIIVCERNDDYSLRNIELFEKTNFGIKNYPISFGTFMDYRYCDRIKLVDTDSICGYFVDTYVIV